MDIATMYVAESIRRERIAHAAQARHWSHQAVTIQFHNRVRQIISARLIAWGEQLR